MVIKSKMKRDKGKGEREKENFTNTVSALQNLVSGEAITMQISCTGSCLYEQLNTSFPSSSLLRQKYTHLLAALKQPSSESINWCFSP